MGSAVEAAASIRQALKAKHITARQVSVRADQYSMGSTIHVRIKDSTVRKAVVEEIANAHEIVHRDSSSGEILCGGNRFVDVGYTEEAFAPLALEIHALLETLELGDGVEYKGGACGHCVTVHLARPTNTGYPEGAIYTARSDGWAQGVEVFAHGKTGCARQVAVILLNGGDK